VDVRSCRLTGIKTKLRGEPVVWRDEAVVNILRFKHFLLPDSHSEPKGWLYRIGTVLASLQPTMKMRLRRYGNIEVGGIRWVFCSSLPLSHVFGSVYNGGCGCSVALAAEIHFGGQLAASRMNGVDPPLRSRKHGSPAHFGLYPVNDNCGHHSQASLTGPDRHISFGETSLTTRLRELVDPAIIRGTAITPRSRHPKKTPIHSAEFSPKAPPVSCDDRAAARLRSKSPASSADRHTSFDNAGCHDGPHAGPQRVFEIPHEAGQMRTPNPI